MNYDNKRLIKIKRRVKSFFFKLTRNVLVYVAWTTTKYDTTKLIWQLSYKIMTLLSSHLKNPKLTCVVQMSFVVTLCGILWQTSRRLYDHVIMRRTLKTIIYSACFRHSPKYVHESINTLSSASYHDFRVAVASSAC